MTDDTVAWLLDEIETILKRDRKTIADLAREIGYNYHQVYAWIRVRRHSPASRGLMRLMRWLDENR